MTSEPSAYEIREIDPQGGAWEDGFAVLVQLRPHLTLDEFTQRTDEARRHDDFRVYGAFAGTNCLGVMGIRRLVDNLHGPHLYIDDLVVTERARSQRIGAGLLAFAEKLAREAGGIGLRLSTGVDQDAARRFYEREGWTLRAVVYKKGF